MKASIDGVVIADAPDSELITIEGNYYFSAVVPDRRSLQRQCDALHLRMERRCAIPRHIRKRRDPSRRRVELPRSVPDLVRSRRK